MSFTEGSTTGTTAGTTPQTAVASSSDRKILRNLSVVNLDTVSATVTIKKGSIIICKVTLSAGDTLTIEDEVVPASTAVTVELSGAHTTTAPTFSANYGTVA